MIIIVFFCLKEVWISFFFFYCLSLHDMVLIRRLSFSRLLRNPEALSSRPSSWLLLFSFHPFETPPLWLVTRTIHPRPPPPPSSTLMAHSFVWAPRSNPFWQPGVDSAEEPVNNLSLSGPDCWPLLSTRGADPPSQCLAAGEGSQPLGGGLRLAGALRSCLCRKQKHVGEFHVVWTRLVVGWLDEGRVLGGWCTRVLILNSWKSRVINKK